MSTTVLHAPRASSAGATTNTAGFWMRLWAALEAHGQRRAAAELRRVASLRQTQDPALARALREAADFADRA